MYFELDMNLTEEQRMLKKAAHKFAREVVRPAAIATDQMSNPEEIINGGSALWEARKKARRSGYHLAVLPKTVGGFELGPVELHILLEELGWGSPGFGVSIILDSFAALMVLMYQPENKTLINEIVMPFVEDVDAKITGCAAITEPDHGSDAIFSFTELSDGLKTAFNTRAELSGDEWIINGQKSSWISNGPIATHVLTFLTVYESKEISGAGIALIPMDFPGVARGKSTERLGCNDFPQCEVSFNDVRIPRDHMIVGPNLYERAIHNIINMAGVSLASACVGLARAAFEEALEYSKQRVQGGKPIVDHQIIKLKLFDMFTKVEAARAFSRAAMKYCLTTTDRIPIEYGAAAKVYCTQVAFEVANEALQIHGSYGLTREFLIGKLFRDARSFLIADGCNEVLGVKRADIIIKNYKPLE